MVPTMPTRELYVQGTQEQQLPGIEPPHWTTEGDRSRHGGGGGIKMAAAIPDSKILGG